MRFRDFHYVRRSDRRVIFFLLAVFIVVSLALLVFHGKETMYTASGNDDSAAVGWRDYRHGYYDYRRGKGNKYYAVRGRSVSRFPFDPNTADSTELLALGLEPWQVRNIYKYRAKGGVFRKKEDFGRVYGLTNRQYRDLAPLIRIGSDYQPYTSRGYQNVPYDEAPDSVPGRRFPAKLRQGERIDLNDADTVLLLKVPGIGPYFARQIVHNRKMLGGFYSVRQLLEIQDMPEEALPYFEVNPAKVHRLNVNKLSLVELRRHPYINYYQAKAIVDYRRLYGEIHDMGQLKLMKYFTPDDFERLRHYIEY